MAVHTDSSGAPYGDRRADILAAAKALRTWAHDRRETWSSLPLDVDISARAARAQEAAARTTADPVPRPLASSPPAAVFERPAPQEHLAPLPVEIFEPEPRPSPPAAFEPVPDVELPPVDTGPSRTARAVRWLTSAIRGLFGSLSAPLVRWWRPVAIAVVAAAILGSAGLAARAYWAPIADAVGARWAALTKPATGTAVLESVPPGSELFIDGTATGVTPHSTELPAGRHVVEFRRRGESRRLEIDVVEGRSTMGRLDWNAPLHGRLQLTSTPEGARVVIGGKPRGVTPLFIDDLVVGSHLVLLEGDSGSVQQRVQIEADRTTEVSVPIYSGWVHVSSPFELEITEGTARLALDDRNQMLLSPGAHTLQFASPAVGFREERRVDVKPGETTRIAIAPPSSSLTVTAVEPAEVLVDGERVGETPLTNHPIGLGIHTIVVRSASGAERQFTTSVTVEPVRLEVDFATP